MTPFCDIWSVPFSLSVLIHLPCFLGIKGSCPLGTIVCNGQESGTVGPPRVTAPRSLDQRPDDWHGKGSRVVTRSTVVKCVWHYTYPRYSTGPLRDLIRTLTLGMDSLSSSPSHFLPWFHLPDPEGSTVTVSVVSRRTCQFRWMCVMRRPYGVTLGFALSLAKRSSY